MPIKKYKKREVGFEETVVDSLAEEQNIMERPIGSLVFYILLFVSVLISSIAIGRVAIWGTLKHEFYKGKALANINKEVPIIAPRGIITDRYGESLLENKAIFSVTLDINAMIKDGREAEILAAAENILKIDPEGLKLKIYGADLENNNILIIAQDVAREDAIKIEGLDINSISISSDYRREYKSEAFSHILGFIGLPSIEDIEGDSNISLIDAVGKNGLEKYYDGILRGKNGKESVFRNAKGESEETGNYTEPHPGETLTTTIDKELQGFFYESLSKNLRAKGQKAGVGIIITPKNGEVLSLISLPSFNPDEIGKYLDNYSHPLFNRAISGAYNPGSTIKPMHAVAALKEGVVNEKTRIYSDGLIEVPNPYNPDLPSYFVDWRPQGWVDVYSAIAKSSNIYFYAIAGGLPKNESGIISGYLNPNGIGIEKINNYWRKFGFGSKTGIDLPNESVGFLPEPEEKEERTGSIWRLGDTYNIAIGQGDVLLTPLQLLNGLIAIINGGPVFKPHIRLTDPEPLFDLSILSQEFAIVRRGMEETIKEPYGTGYYLSSLPFKTAGKTGSAQVSGNTKTNALFIGYGPTDEYMKDKQIAMLILIEDAQEGSLNAIPIAKEVFEWYYMNRLTK